MDYFTADLHFNHNNIIKYCGRGAYKDQNSFRSGTERLFNDVTEMNEHLIKTWNEIVKDNDRVYVLGDVAFGSKSEAITLCNRLKGRKTLIYGNHDLKYSKSFWHDAGFDLVHKLGYGAVAEYQEFYLAHYPYRKALMQHDTREYLRDHAPVEQDKVLLHGHVHTQWIIKDNMINVGVDVWNYRPVSITEIRGIVKHRGMGT